MTYGVGNTGLWRYGAYGGYGRYEGFGGYEGIRGAGARSIKQFWATNSKEQTS